MTMTERLIFNSSADQDSRDVLLDGKRIAMLQSHKGDYRVVFSSDGPFVEVALTTLDEIVKEKNRLFGKNLTPVSNLIFRMTMDPHSNSIYKENKSIGILRWHSGIFNALLFSDSPLLTISISDIDAVLKQRDDIVSSQA